MRKFIDLTGTVFNKLTIVKFSHKDDSGISYWECLCECGRKKTIRSSHIKSGLIQSCGCYQAKSAGDRARKHGLSFTRTHNAWCGMKTRCLNKKNPDYKEWGGRGIKICDRWMDFENFYQDMGDCPTKMSIDRINVNGNYEPGNCKWSTAKEQSNNRRPRRKL